jgi:hypothetical protein
VRRSDELRQRCLLVGNQPINVRRLRRHDIEPLGSPKREISRQAVVARP